MFHLSTIGHNLFPQPKISTMINRFSMTVCWMLDQPSFIRRFNSSISRTQRILLDPRLRHCRDSVNYWSLDLLWSHRLGAIKVQRLATKLVDGCACSVLARCTLTLKLVPVSEYIGYVEYTGDRTFIEVHVCQNRRNKLSFDNAIAKIKRCSFLPHMVLRDTKSSMRNVHKAEKPPDTQHTSNTREQIK